MVEVYFLTQIMLMTSQTFKRRDAHIVYLSGANLPTYAVILISNWREKLKKNNERDFV
jgi:hypothetical protein